MSGIRIYLEKEKKSGASSSTLKEGQIERKRDKKGTDMTRMVIYFSDNFRLITWMVTLVNFYIWNIPLEESVSILAPLFFPHLGPKWAAAIFWWTFQSLHLMHCQYLPFFALIKKEREIGRNTNINQRCQTQFLEGRISAQFSSSQLQLTPAWKFLVILKTLIRWIGVLYYGWS